jgi:chromosome segregation ATPase
MGLFFFRKEIEREQFAQRLDSLESQIEKIANVIARHAEKITSPHSELNEMIEKSKLHDELLMHQSRMINSMQEKIDSLEYELTRKIGNEVAKQIQSAKAVDKAHETNPSLAKRMQAKRIRRVGTYAERQYNEPFQIAWVMKNNGYTRAQIANVLNAKGFKTPQSNEFSKGAVTDLMHNLHQKKQMEYKQTKITNLNVTSMPKSVDFLDGIQ